MLKKLVRHEQFGEGRVTSFDKSALRVLFLDQNGVTFEQAFASDAIRTGVVNANVLEKGRICQGPFGECEVLRVLPITEGLWRSYEVLDRLNATHVLLESELEPLRSTDLPQPSTRLAGREIHHLAQFRSREAFRTACIKNFRQGGKLSAILSARIDLLPHQAFVAGTVLDDRRKRYILADEVGLGKTVEAGIVIHDLLSGNLRARVLIVCPGTLTEQWLCEIYSKFGGQIFTLVDLHAESDIQWSEARRVIVSTTQILQFAAEPILSQAWDLVVVDECHHLLSAPSLYDFASKLSRRARSLLLLSAIPAQQKEDEYFKLLALLEPDKFDLSRDAIFEHFKELYDNQASLSRRLQPLIIRIRGVSTNDYSLDDVGRQVKRLLELPLLQADNRLKQLQDQFATGSDGQLSIAQQIVDHVADRYRLYRRILRNRRKALQSESKIDIVVRDRDIVTYAPGPLEEQAWRSVDALLQNSWTEAEEPELVLAFARATWQSLASSDCALDLLSNVPEKGDAALNSSGREFLALGYLAGYEDWTTYCALLQRAAASFLDRSLLEDAVRSIQQWADSGEQGVRYKALIETIRLFWEDKGNSKLLLFAGYPDLAEEVQVALSSELGDDFVVGFRSDMSRAEKEEAAQRFRNNRGKTILVCDESGGEGRNFEFADAVMHYDTPFQVARVEQRIGRLDRIGRSRTRNDVRSLVLCAMGTIEEALIRCYDEGVNVYRESVSGLEFSLRDQERLICIAALEGGAHSLLAMVEALREAADRERNRDEYDSLLDWASYNEDRAQTFLSVRSKSEVESALESSFIEYFQSLSKTKAVRQFSDKKTPVGLWEFNLDSLQSGVVPTDVARTVVGTFKRDIALSRLDRTFFQIGNPLFDALEGASSSHPSLRTYAVQCRAVEEWIGFEFVYSAQPDMNGLGGRSDLHTLVQSYFSLVPVHVFIDLQGVEGDHAALKLLRQSLTREKQDKTWVNLWREREKLIDGFVSESSWISSISELEAKARLVAKGKLSERMIAAEDLKLRWSAAAKRFREAQTAISLEEAETLDLLIAAVSGWTTYQESAGFLVATPRFGWSL